MRKPFIRNIDMIKSEQAHMGSGKRQILLSEKDKISSSISGATKGYLPTGKSFDWHEYKGVDEFFIVLQGRGMVDFEDGTSFEYKEGDLVYMPSGQEHRILNTGTMENIFFFFRVKD